MSHSLNILAELLSYPTGGRSSARFAKRCRTPFGVRKAGVQGFEVQEFSIQGRRSPGCYETPIYAVLKRFGGQRIDTPVLGKP